MDHNVPLGAVTLVLEVLMAPYYTIHGKGHRIPRGLPVALSVRYHLPTTTIRFPLRQRAHEAEKHSLTSPGNLQSMKQHNRSLQPIATGVLYALILG